MVIEGKLVWIVGASSGIGEALAEALARRGARLVLSARRAERLESVRSRLEGAGGPHAVEALDLTAAHTLAPVARRVLERYGTPDLLVLNAGVSQRSLARDTRVEVDRRLLETNFLGPIAVAKAVLPAMRQRGSGRMVAVTSLVGKIGTPLRSGYAASKHALHGFFDSLRAEEHASGLRVTLVCPGFIRTELPMSALTGDGTPQATMDRAQLEGMPPGRCAARIVAAIERGRDEVLIGGREVWAVRLRRFFPGLFNRIIRRARVT